MKHYVVTKKDDGKVEAKCYTTDEYYALKVYPRIVSRIPYHSPLGFDYGYRGSGPADLAIALLAHYMCESKRKVLAFLKGKGTACVAAIYHQEFMDATVACWDYEMKEHTISSEEIHDILLTIMKVPFNS